MAEAVFGLDFGTTNSLLTVIVNGRPVHLVDEKDRPHPSVIWYHGGDVVVGRRARDNLDAGPEAVTGSFVRSPKRLLDSDAPWDIGGRNLDPRDIIGEVLRFLRREAIDANVTKESPDRVVMTIPVKLDGASRRRLREAARVAGIGIVQFVHEPLAALYAYLRSQKDYRKSLAELDGCRVLVFDWGGGTLDLTLCQVERDQIIQIDNLGDNDVGGDRFDEIVRNRVRDAHARQHGLDDLVPLERDEARISLLTQCELAKIDLSQKETATVFRRNYLRHDGPARDLSIKISRDDLAAWTRDLVDRGLGAIDALLERNQISFQQIALCLPTGGMVNMPAVRDGLTERFGGRARRISNGDRIISEGAAWKVLGSILSGNTKRKSITRAAHIVAAAATSTRSKAARTKGASGDRLICKFRHLIEENGPGHVMLRSVNDHLKANGFKVGTGTIMDATLISAPSSTKNAKGERDPEMHQTKKGNQWYFGMKGHVGVDSKERISLCRPAPESPKAAERSRLPWPVGVQVLPGPVEVIPRHVWTRRALGVHLRRFSPSWKLQARPGRKREDLNACPRLTTPILRYNNTRYANGLLPRTRLSWQRHFVTPCHSEFQQNNLT